MESITQRCSRSIITITVAVEQHRNRAQRRHRSTITTIANQVRSKLRPHSHKSHWFSSLTPRTRRGPSTSETCLAPVCVAKTSHKETRNLHLHTSMPLSKVLWTILAPHPKFKRRRDPCYLQQRPQRPHRHDPDCISTTSSPSSYSSVKPRNSSTNEAASMMQSYWRKKYQYPNEARRGRVNTDDIWLHDNEEDDESVTSHLSTSAACCGESMW